MPPQKSPEAFRTISEVADWLGVNPHVLRFWESKFSQIKPIKRAGGRRYYRVADMELLGGLKQLLHEDGLTIKGAQKVLRERGVKAVQALSPPVDAPPGGRTGEAGASLTEEPVTAEGPASAESSAPAEGPAEEPWPVEAPASAEGPEIADEPDRADEPAMPEIAPLPGTGSESQPGLFADLPPLSDPQHPAPHDPHTREPDAAADPAPGAPASDEVAAATGPVPEIAPLPGPRPTLSVALSRLRPGQIPADEIAPILVRARALRARMQTAASARSGGQGGGTQGGADGAAQGTARGG